jgi:hypothetical protein
MASKFMANAAFGARLLLRPSHQRTALFGTVNKLGRPTLPPILSSRSYSDSNSTPTPRFPESSGSTPTLPLSKTSGSTERSQFFGPADKTYSESTPTPPLPKTSGSTESSQSPGLEDKNRSPPKVWVKGGAAWALAWALTGAVAVAFAGALVAVGTVHAGSFWCHLKHADYQRVLPDMSTRKRGKIGTKHLRDVNTNLHANLQSMISSKRDRYLRR